MAAAAAAADTSAASTTGLALSEASINWERLDKTKFHVIGAILFTAQQGVLHPTAVVKTRMQVAEGGLSHMSGFVVFRKILRSDGIPGVFRGFGTSAVGALPGRILALTSLEMSKEMAFKYSEHFDMSEASRIAVANGVAGLVSSTFSSSYSVPLDVLLVKSPTSSTSSPWSFWWGGSRQGERRPAAEDDLVAVFLELPFAVVCKVERNKDAGQYEDFQQDELQPYRNCGYLVGTLGEF